MKTTNGGRNAKVIAFHGRKAGGDSTFPSSPSFVELHCRSCFSLLDGASTPEALIDRARALGMSALALTDRNELGGVVRFAEAGRVTGVGAIVGVELSVMTDESVDGVLSTSLVLLAESSAGYANISTLITRARMDRARGEPAVPLETLACHAEGVYALTGGPSGWIPRLLAQGDAEGAWRAATWLREVFGDRLAIECWDHRLPEERALVAQLIPLARRLGAPWVVANDVHYALPAQRHVHDVLASLRYSTTLDAMGTRLRPNAEWHLKGAEGLARRWRHAPEGLRMSCAIAERCGFRLEHLEPSLPDFPLPPGVSADAYLERLVWQGASERWGAESLRGGGTAAAEAIPLSPPGVKGIASAPEPAPSIARGPRNDTRKRQLDHELGTIRRMGLAGFFLIVWDIVRYALRNGILCQGRGSAANSAVCYCLGITAVDPIRMELLFERFLSEDRREAPDIDIDFAHRERERVIQYVYNRYGRDHAAMVCEQITWRGRSAVRDAARVLGFTVQQADALAAFSDRFSAKATAEALRGRGKTDAYTQDSGDGCCGGGEARRQGGKAVRRQGGQDAQLAHALGQRMIPGTEASTKARAALESGRRTSHSVPTHLAALPPDRLAAFMDPHADSDHIERRNPVTSLVGSTEDESIAEKAGLDLADPRVALLAEIVEGMHQLPRHRSIHVGGFVLSREPLSRVVPIEPASMPERTVIQWEKDDLDPVGLVKIDLLGLGMLTLLQDCLLYIRQTRGVSLDLASIPMDDPAVYDDLCRADTVGIFQVESRAQMNTLPRLKPRSFYDLVVEVALIRPGPIQGDMVHPYLRRRAGLEPVTYSHPSLEPVLRRTLGVPLFQEQGMQVAIAAAGFSPGQADELRRAMGHKRSHERMARIGSQLIEGMKLRGISAESARKIYQQINAFADYGFPESHAASFALLVYASAWLRHYYAPEYTAAILNAQPMGFYSPGTLVEDARRHGVVVRPVDVTTSKWDATLEVPESQRSRVSKEPGSSYGTTSGTLAPWHSGTSVPAVRLGYRSIRGLGNAARDRIEPALAEGPFTSITDFVRRTGLDRGVLRSLAEAGAFDMLVAHEPQERRRRAALWEVLEAARRFDKAARRPGGKMEGRQDGKAASAADRTEAQDALPLLAALPPSRLPASAPVPSMTPYEITESDYRMTALSLNGHPMKHLRAEMDRVGVVPAEKLGRKRDGEPVLIAGLVICRQRPGTAKGFVFLTLEDETGMVNVVVTPDRFERQALLIARSPLLLIRGVLQIEGLVVNVRAKEFRLLSAPVGAEFAQRHDFH